METNQRAKAISKIKFYSINRDIKASVAAGNWNAGRIANAHHVSDETVRAIKRTRTWPAWEIAKQVRRSQVNATYVISAKAPEQMMLVQPVSDPEDEQLAKELEEVTRCVTWNEYEGLLNAVRKLRRRLEVLEDQPQRRSRRSIFARRG